MYYTIIILKTANRGTLEKDSQIIGNFILDCPIANDAFWEDGTTKDYVDWPNSNSDLSIFSQKYPDLVFQLDVEGEDNEESRTYFQNGKSHSAKIQKLYESFNPLVLK